VVAPLRLAVNRGVLPGRRAPYGAGVDNVVALRRPGPSRRKGLKVLLGVVLAAWAMLFASLVLSLAFIRAQAPSWPPPDAVPPEAPGAAWVGGLLACAVVAVALGGRAQARGRAAVAGALLLLGAALVLASVTVEVHLFLQARRQGGAMRDAFGSAYRSFLLLHAVHVGTALPALCWVAARAVRRPPDAGPPAGARALGVYLGFSTLVFGVMSLLVHAGP
jgi:heme/copper-type cytochrome/quinol oxidase subunit 3